MGTLLVTGGAGFIGSALVRVALERTEDRIVVFDKLTYAGHEANLAGLPDDRVELLVADLADRPSLEAAFEEHRPRAVFNLAAESHVDRSIDGPRPFIETNIVGTFELLETARSYYAALDADERDRFRLIHVSTDEVFGDLGDEGRFDEDSPYAPSSPYAASKASADHLVRAWHRTWGLPALITNCSNNYGPRQLPEKLIPLMILNAHAGRDLPIYGDGSQVRDWIHVDDHCRGLLQVLEQGRVGRSYNLGAGSERTNLELVRALCAALEEVAPAAHNPALRARELDSYLDLMTFVVDRPGHDRRYAIDPTRARTELDWRPAVDLESGLTDTVRWYLGHRDWCETVGGGDHAATRRGIEEIAS